MNNKRTVEDQRWVNAMSAEQRKTVDHDEAVRDEVERSRIARREKAALAKRERKTETIELNGAQAAAQFAQIDALLDALASGRPIDSAALIAALRGDGADPMRTT